MVVVWDAGAVIVLVLKRAFVVWGVVVVATGVLAGGGGDLNQVLDAIDQEAGPTEMSC